MNIFNKSLKIENEHKSTFKDSFKMGLSKFSKGLFASISLMSLAGIILAIGNLWSMYDTSPAPLIFKSIGDITLKMIPLMFAITITFSFVDKTAAVFAAVMGWFILQYVPSLTLTPVDIHNIPVVSGSKGIIDHYRVFNAWNIPLRSINNVLGWKTIDTSVFGAFVISALTIFVYKKTAHWKLYSIFKFWEGERLVPFTTMVLSIFLSLLFVLIYPFFSMGIGKLAIGMSNLGYGINSFIFIAINRFLLPFGLHHAWYSPIFYSPAGGTLEATDTFSKAVTIHGHVFAKHTELWKIFPSIFTNGQQSSPISGDLNMIQKLNGTTMNYDFLKMIDRPTGNGTFEHISLNPGQYSGVFVPNFMFGIPAASLVMVVLAPKEKRKEVGALMFSAAMPAFLVGITEPFEFTFLFLSPVLYYVFYTTLCGIGGILVNLFGVHMGPSGFQSLLLEGALPYAAGQTSNNFYMIFVAGAIVAPIYFVVFYFWIKIKNIPTPGRDGSKISLISKAKYKTLIKSRKNKNVESYPNKKVLNLIIQSLGGKDNIVKVDNCFTRLRVDIENSELFDESYLKDTGYFGIAKVGNKHIQIIFGIKANEYKLELEKYLNDKTEWELENNSKREEK